MIKRFIRLPDEQIEQDKALNAARPDDPDAKVIQCGPPVGPVLKVDGDEAWAAARLSVDAKPSKLPLR